MGWLGLGLGCAEAGDRWDNCTLRRYPFVLWSTRLYSLQCCTSDVQRRPVLSAVAPPPPGRRREGAPFWAKMGCFMRISSALYPSRVILRLWAMMAKLHRLQHPSNLLLFDGFMRRVNCAWTERSSQARARARTCFSRIAVELRSYAPTLLVVAAL